MGLKTADMPPVDPAEFGSVPFLDRMRLLGTHWAEYGFGAPKQLQLLYVFKFIFYIILGLVIVGFTTPSLGGWGAFGSWWDHLILYQKLMVWTVLFEVLGLASSSGPLAFKFAPMIGGVLAWTKTGTIRIPPYPKHVPLTSGDHRTVWDVGVYLLILANLVFLLGHPGTSHSGFPGGATGTLLPVWALYSYIGLILLMGLRDKVVFLAARSEQYLAILIFFATFHNVVDMVIGAKIAMAVIWLGASFSKLGVHFTPVVSAMLSNTPWITSKKFKRSLYKNFPENLHPSKVSWSFAHIGGTVVELVLPLVVLFSTNRTLTALAIGGLIIFHIFIISTFPLAVPIEWNVFFIFVTWFLFWQFPAAEGWAVSDISSGGLLALILVMTLTFPILGNLKPEWVSFLISMRQYAGNWPVTMWVFKDREAEEKLNQNIKKVHQNSVDQLSALYGPEVAEIFTQKVIGWRMLHPHGRAMVSLLWPHVENHDTAFFREGEVVCTTIIGWQFGDGHLHDERLIDAVQERCNYEPGELVVVYIESQPIHRDHLEYRIIDAALGVVEKGTYKAKDSAEADAYLAGGLIPRNVTWTKPGYVAAHPE